MRREIILELLQQTSATECMKLATLQLVATETKISIHLIHLQEF